MNPEIEFLLAQIHDETVFLLEYAADFDFDEFDQDRAKQHVVERAFERIGEGVRRIAKRDPEFVERIPRFREIISFRNLIAHEYDELDNLLMWRTITEVVPGFQSSIEELLGMEPSAD